MDAKAPKQDSQRPNSLSRDGSRLRPEVLQPGASLDLRHDSIDNEDLTSRDLSGALFEDCTFIDCKFDSAVLDGATFTRCVFSRSTFRRASLRGAIFQQCTGLSGKEFAAANLEGAILPEIVAKFQSLARIAEISKRANTILGTLIAGCLTSAIIISKATDLALLTNLGSLPLPVATTKVPTATFFVVMPCLLVAIWIYLQLTLNHLLQEFSALPEVFPDGDARYQKADFWLLGGYVWSFSGDRTASQILMVRLVLFRLVVWSLVPAIVLAFWTSYLRIHDATGSTFQIGAFSVLLVFGVYIAGSTRTEFVSTAALSAPRQVRRYGLSFAVLLILVVMTDAARNGAPPTGPDFMMPPNGWVRSIGLNALSLLHIRTVVNLREMALSSDKESLNAIDMKYSDSYHLNATSANMRNATMVGAFLSKAVLSKTHLDNANLQYAHLDEADFTGAFLDEASLELSSASSGHFEGAHMSFAKLTEASLQDANFTGADLLGADLRGADLRNAIFKDADLTGADFYLADLRGANFEGARNMASIKCIARANVAGTNGLRLNGLEGALDVLHELVDDGYRRSLKKRSVTLLPACGLNFAIGIEARGPPSWGASSIRPRSLRFFPFELPPTLPRYIQQDVRVFLEAVQKVDTHDSNKAFAYVGKQLRYVKPELEDQYNIGNELERKVPRDDNTESMYLMRGLLTCADGTKGFELRLFSYINPNRIALDEYIESVLATPGEDVVVQDDWTLKSPNGGIIRESSDRGIQYLSCPIASP
jgi:uncharacterized protein YjbI with pentapeptide repeats